MSLFEVKARRFRSSTANLQENMVLGTEEFLIVRMKGESDEAFALRQAASFNLMHHNAELNDLSRKIVRVKKCRKLLWEMKEKVLKRVVDHRFIEQMIQSKIRKLVKALKELATKYTRFIRAAKKAQLQLKRFMAPAGNRGVHMAFIRSRAGVMKRFIRSRVSRHVTPWELQRVNTILRKRFLRYNTPKVFACSVVSNDAAVDPGPRFAHFPYIIPRFKVKASDLDTDARWYNHMHSFFHNTQSQREEDA